VTLFDNEEPKMVLAKTIVANHKMCFW